MREQWTRNIVTKGLDRRGPNGAVIERLQPNHVTHGWDKYGADGRLDEHWIPDPFGGFRREKVR